MSRDLAVNFVSSLGIEAETGAPECGDLVDDLLGDYDLQLCIATAVINPDKVLLLAGSYVAGPSGLARLDYLRPAL